MEPILRSALVNALVLPGPQAKKEERLERLRSSRQIVPDPPAVGKKREPIAWLSKEWRMNCGKTEPAPRKVRGSCGETRSASVQSNLINPQICDTVGTSVHYNEKGRGVNRINLKILLAHLSP